MENTQRELLQEWLTLAEEVFETFPQHILSSGWNLRHQVIQAVEGDIPPNVFNDATDFAAESIQCASHSSDKWSALYTRMSNVKDTACKGAKS